MPDLGIALQPGTVKQLRFLLKDLRKALGNRLVVQRYGENLLVHRLLEIVERAQIVGVVEFEGLVLAHLIAELTDGVYHRVAHIHQLALATEGIDESLNGIVYVGEVS